VFQRIGKIPDPPVLPIVPSPEVFHYRGKGEYHLRRGKGGVPAFGFMDVRGGTVVPVSRCLLMDDSINGAANRFFADVLAGRAAVPDGRYVFWSGWEAAGPGLPGEGLPFPAVTRQVKGVSFLVPGRAFSRPISSWPGRSSTRSLPRGGGTGRFRSRRVLRFRPLLPVSRLPGGPGDRVDSDGPAVLPPGRTRCAGDWTGSFSWRVRRRKPSGTSTGGERASTPSCSTRPGRAAGGPSRDPRGRSSPGNRLRFLQSRHPGPGRPPPREKGFRLFLFTAPGHVSPDEARRGDRPAARS
jgi:hypothetical protein